MAYKCCTEITMDKLTFEWTINKLSYCREETGERLVSSVFPCKANGELQWRLYLYPRGVKEEFKDYLSLFLKLMSSTRTEVRAKFIFSILNAKGEKAKELDDQTAGKFSKESRRLGYHKFFERDILFNEKEFLLPDDKLTILCEVTVLTGSIIASGDNNPVSVPECSLSKDLSRLFEDHQLSDVILSTPSKEYKAHKAILAARSPVFAAMFQHEMEENKSNRIDIADVDEEVLEEILRYMYTGYAPNLDKMADKLLIAADKYDMKRLKALSEKSLCDNLAVGNAADALAIADIHGAEVLKERATIFINRHLAEITDTAGWGKVLFSHHLVTEVCRVSVKPMIVDNKVKKETI